MNGRSIWNDRLLANSVEARTRLTTISLRRARAEQLEESTTPHLEVRVLSKYSFEFAEHLLVYSIDYLVRAEELSGEEEDQSASSQTGLSFEVTFQATYAADTGYVPVPGELEAFGEISVVATTMPYLREIVHSLSGRMGVPILVDIPQTSDSSIGESLAVDTGSRFETDLSVEVDPEMVSELEEFALFLEDANPMDFDRSSAFFTEQVRYTEGAAGFQEFVNVHVGIAEAEFVDGEGDVDTWITLATADKESDFEGYPDETNMEMFIRVQREARDMDATMVFVAMRLWGSTDEVEIDGMDSSAIREGVRAGALTEHYGWYAELRQAEGKPARVSGLWEIRRDEQGEEYLDQYTTGVPAVAPLFNMILDY